MSEGSYNEALANDVCSSASVIWCRETGMKASVTWVERSNAQTADNYRAELMGAVALQIMISTALDGKYVSLDMKPRFGCDNKTVVYHGNHPRRPMPEKQAQADILRHLKKLVRDSPCPIKFYHVFGHLDQLLEWYELTLEERANVECDRLADDALAIGIESGVFIDRVLPHEELVVTVGEEKISGSSTVAIYRHWGRSTAREHYHTKNIVHWDHFDEVDWHAMGRVTSSVPEMYSIWLTKQVSGFCGTNHMLNNIYGDVADCCPNCGFSPERSRHIPLCPDAGRTTTYTLSVQRLVEWLDSQQTDPELTLLLRGYLLGRGRTSMSSLCTSSSPYITLATNQDKLGFHNFIEGRVSTLFGRVRQWDITRRRLRKHAPHWVNGLILRLTQITHRQWTYRNQSVHYKGADGLTEKQQLRIMRNCEALLWTDPSALLDEDKDLLEMDFEDLGAGPAIARQTWIAEMEAALAFASEEPQADEKQTDTEAPVDTEGSIRFKRRRRRNTGRLRTRPNSITRNG